MGLSFSILLAPGHGAQADFRNLVTKLGQGSVLHIRYLVIYDLIIYGLIESLFKAASTATLTARPLDLEG